MEYCFIIPVREGSVSVPGKNKKSLAGKPLIQFAIDAIRKFNSIAKIIVATDSDELSYIAKSLSCDVYKLERQTGKETLDEVILKVASDKKTNLSPESILFTIQATCPFLKPETIQRALESLNQNSGSVITVKDDRHLTWNIDENGKPTPGYSARVNRQELPPSYRESGAIIGTFVKNILEHKTRVIDPINLITVDKLESLDIDDFTDWKVAEYIAKKKKILIKADSSVKIGMGHLYRSATLAYELAHHDLTIVSNTHGDKKLSEKFFDDKAFNFISVDSDQEFIDIAIKESPELIILDQLDTEKDYVNKLKESRAKIITFEDMGSGAKHADLLISDLYKNNEIDDSFQLSGVENAFLNPSFEWVSPKALSPEVNSILLLFGGTDPSDLTRKTLNALQKFNFKGHINLIQGLGKEKPVKSLEEFDLKGEIFNNVKFMPELMLKSDLALSSAGRTVTELMSSGVPTICICQNEKEMTHTHASQAYGILNLGLGSLLDEDTLLKNLSFVINNKEFREHMYKRSSYAIKDRSNKKIIKKIEEILEIELL